VGGNVKIIERLASSLGRRDEIPNQELAKEIVDNSDEEAIKKLVTLLIHKKKDIQNDSIKVLYEIGERKPSLISNYVNEFVLLLNHKNNRLQWGGMTALGTVVNEKPGEIYALLPQILDTANKGSIITKDHAVNVLIGLCSNEKFSKSVFPLLMEQLLSSPTNQLPMYAEKALPIINKDNKEVFIQTLSSRLNDIEKETKRKRIEKVIAKAARL